MDTLARQANAQTPLAQWLADRGPLSAFELMRLMRTLAMQLARRHEQCLIYGQLTSDAVVVEGDGLARLVEKAQGPTAVVQLAEELSPPELRDRGPISVPVDLSAASTALSDERGPFDARRIDVYQLGALVVQAATGGSVNDYLCRPLVSARVPAPIRPVLDQALGFSPGQRISTCMQLLDALATAEGGASLSARETPSRGVAIQDSDTDAAAAGRGLSHPPHRNSDDLPLKRLGPYDIVARLGSGGMGDVYQGYDASLDRYVAIKVLPAELARQPDFVTRFRTEAAAAAKVEHPNIVPIFTIGADAGHHFFAMQFVAGQSLAQRLAKQPKPAVETTLSIVEQVLAGLAAAHRHGLVHRDIKPGNILLAERDGRALLADFGLVKTAAQESRMTATGVIMGTVDYISPEQGRGKPVDGRSDLYSIGVLLYQMLAGRLPFSADSPTAMIFQHAYESPPLLASIAPEVPPPLAAAVHKLLAKSPDDRYQTCDELIVDLQAIRRGELLPGSGRVRLGSTGREQTAVIIAPRFQDEPDAPTTGATAFADSWWSSLHQQALLWLGRQAPEVVRRLQNTQQQVDGAVLEYEQRCQSLGRLVREAEQVQRLLRQQIEAHQSAADQSEQRISAADDEEAKRLASAEREVNREAAAQLQQQLSQQQNELETMQLALAKANARLAGLKGQRDALNARLKIAQVRFGLADGRRRVRISRRLVAAGIVGAAAVFVGLGIWMIRQPEATPAQAKSQEPDSNEGSSTDGSQSPNPGGRLPMDLTVDQATQSTTLPVRATVMEPFASTSDAFFNVAIGGEDGSLMSLQSRDGKIFNGGGRRHTAHVSAITDLTFCTRTNRMASSSSDGEVLIWDWNPRTILRRLPHGEEVSALAFSPDGSQLLTGTLHGVRCWDVASGNELERYADLPLGNWANSLAWLPDGTGFVEALRINGAESVFLVGMEGRRQLPLQGIKATTSHVAVLAGGSQAIAASRGAMMVWNLSDGSKVREFGDRPTAAAYSHFGGRALLGNAQGALTLWNIAAGEKVQDVGMLPGRIEAVGLSPRGDTGIAAAGTTLRVFALPAEVIPHLKQTQRSPAPIQSLSFSPTDFRALSAGPQQVRTWNLRNVNSGNAELSGAAPAAVAEYSPDGTRMLVARPVPDRQGLGPLMLRAARYPLPSDPVLRRYRGHSGGTTAAAFVRNGAQIVSGGNDNHLRTWETATEQELDSLEVGIPVKSLAVSRDGKLAVLAGDQVDIDVWNLESKVRAGALKGHSLAVRALALARTVPRAVSASGDRTARVWDVAALQNLATFDHPAGVTTAAISADGNWIVTGSQDGVLRFWDVASKMLRGSISAHQAPISALALAPDERTVLSAGEDQILCWWDVP